VSDPPIKLLLVDDDPIFSLGLRTALQNNEALQVIVHKETAKGTLEQLATTVNPDFPDLAVIELGIQPIGSGLQLCQQLKQQYDLPILLLSRQAAPQDLGTAKAIGVEGYCPKGISIAQLVPILRQVASRTPYWQPFQPTTLPLQTSRTSSLLTRIGNSGLQQIEASLQQVRRQLAKPNLSDFDWFYWSGRERELKAAYWIVNRLLPVEVMVVSELTPPPPMFPERQPEGSRNTALTLSEESNQPNLRLRESRPVEPLVKPFPAQSPAALLWENTLNRIQTNVRNLTGTPLELDVLQRERKQELLYLVLQNFGKILEEQRFLNLQPETLPEARLRLLRDLWQSTTLDFFVKYYPSLTGVRDYSIVDLIMENAPLVETTLLAQIPQTTELFAYLLFDKPLVVGQVPYPPHTPEAMARAELLLHNLVLQTANGVMQFLMNYFPEVEVVKHTLYAPGYRSSRDIARFRNDLSWRSRRQYYLDEPLAIFESQYFLYVLDERGIRLTKIYAPRQLELERLQGIRWSVTIALELRDAIAPRLRSVVAVVGKTAVYVLTQVVGRAIGLVGRGVVQGIGNTLQDARYSKDRSQETDR
jgi:DNA-binding NarL/FixJ family response regulator